MAIKYMLEANALIGGVDGAVDSINTTSVPDGTHIRVDTGLKVSGYILNAASVAPTDLPDTIKPVLGPGAWELTWESSSALGSKSNVLRNSSFTGCSNSTFEDIGVSLVTGNDSNFSGAGNWVLNVNWSVTAGVLRASAASLNTYLALSGLEIGGIYTFYITLSAYTSGTCHLAATENIGTPTLKAGPAAVPAGTMSITWRATETNNLIMVVPDTPLTADFDTALVYKGTPGFVAANTLAFDGHSKTSTLKAYQIKNIDNTYGKGKFLNKLVKGVDGPEYYNFDKLFSSYKDFQGLPVVFGVKVYSETESDNVKLSIHDGNSEIALSSSYASADTIEPMSVSGTVSNTATKVQCRILLDGSTGDVAYISHDIMVPGDSIDEDDYIQPAGEIILADASDIALTNYSGASVSSDIDIDMELETLGKVPDIFEALIMKLEGDSSSPGDLLQLGSKDISVYSQVNSVLNFDAGLVRDYDGDGKIQLTRDATFDNVSINVQGILI